MTNTLQTLREIVKLTEKVKLWSDGMAAVGRLLVDEESAHELQDLAREAGSNIATAEGNFATLGRLTPHSKKFISVK